MVDPAWVQVGIACIVAGVGGFTAYREVGQYKARGADDRTIQLHRDLTTGEIGAARDRFTELMYRTGEEIESRRCYQPTFSDLLHPRYSGEGCGQISKYPRSIHAPDDATPMQDLYKILWTFERINASVASNRLDRKLTLDLLGSHGVWWNELLARVTNDDTMHRKSLSEFARWVINQAPQLAILSDDEFVN